MHKGKVRFKNLCS